MKRALLFAVVLLAAVGTASAFTVTAEGVPDASQVGTEVSMTYTIDDPFTDVEEEWTLRGSTDLRNVSWTVTVLRAGNQVSESTYGSATFEQDLNIDNNGDQVRIELVGTTPAVDNYSYSPAQSYTAASLARVTGNNTDEFENASVHHYTSESADARAAIEDAETAVDEIGGHDEAETLLDSAKSAYGAENFDNAVTLANQAQEKAESARQSRQTTNVLLLGGGVVAVLLALVGGVYYWKSQQDEYGRL